MSMSLHVPPTTTLAKIPNEDPDVTQIKMEQVPISSDICVADNTTVDGHARKWNLEKFVYRRVLKRGARYDRKFVVQARHAAATGVHMSMNMKKGKNVFPRGNKIRYYHYTTRSTSGTSFATRSSRQRIKPTSIAIAD